MTGIPGGIASQNAFALLAIGGDEGGDDKRNQGTGTETEVKKDARPYDAQRGREGQVQENLTAALAKARISGASTSDADDWPVITGTMIQEAVLRKLIQMNKDSGVLGKRPDDDQINQEITEKVNKSGFRRIQRGLDSAYIYEGDNAAKALREFSLIRPIVHDPSSMLSRLIQEVLLDMLGDAHFNAFYIGQACKNILSIAPGQLPPAPIDMTFFYRARQEKTEFPLPRDIRNGDHLRIQGPSDVHTWHPDSALTEICVLVDKRDTGEVFLVECGSNVASAHGPLSYKDFKKILLEKRSAFLSLRAFMNLKAMSENYPQEFAPLSSLCHQSAYEWLRNNPPENSPEAFKQALALLEKRDVDLDQPTGLLPPKSDTINGVVQCIRMRDEPISRKQFIDDLEQRDIYHPQSIPPTDPQGKLGGLIPEFEARLPHFRKLYAAIENFYKACIDKANPSFPGLFLCGVERTGKTMVCNALAERLTENHCSVWHLDAQKSKTLLSPEEMEEFEAQVSDEISDDASDEDTEEALDEARIEWMKEKFQQAWGEVDVVLIDDADRNVVLRSASDALVRHAKEAGGKKFLLIYHRHFSVSSEALESGWNTFHSIAGPSFQKEATHEDDELE